MGRQVIVMIMVMIISMRQKAMVVRGELEGWLYFEDVKGTHLRGSQVSKHLLLLVFHIWVRFCRTGKMAVLCHFFFF